MPSAPCRSSVSTLTRRSGCFAAPTMAASASSTPRTRTRTVSGSLGRHLPACATRFTSRRRRRRRPGTSCARNSRRALRLCARITLTFTSFTALRSASARVTGRAFTRRSVRRRSRGSCATSASPRTRSVSPRRSWRAGSMRRCSFHFPISRATATSRLSRRPRRPAWASSR